MTHDWHHCRYCGQTSYRASEDMWRYGTRHWAHKTCYLERRGLEGLRLSQLETAPYFKLKELGLLLEVERRLVQSTTQYPPRRAAP